MDIKDQEQLSEKLQLLAHFLYSDIGVPYSGAGDQTSKHLCSLATNHEIRLLDTIAIALTTGEPGDVYTAAFDKQNHFALVLAKNGLVVSLLQITPSLCSDRRLLPRNFVLSSLAGASWISKSASVMFASPS